MAIQTERMPPIQCGVRSACSLLCSMIPATLANFVVHLLHFWRYDGPFQAAVTPANNNPILNFELRHQHAVSSTARVVFADVPAAQMYTHRDGRTPYQVRTRRIITHRPSSFCEYAEARMRSIRQAQSQVLLWDDSEVIGPDVESRETLLELAKMTNNAYVEPEDPYWYDLGDDWPEVRYLFKLWMSIQPGSI
jgi:lipase ATG15